MSHKLSVLVFFPLGNTWGVKSVSGEGYQFLDGFWDLPMNCGISQQGIIWISGLMQQSINLLY
jgi:hypothetical protein